MDALVDKKCVCIAHALCYRLCAIFLASVVLLLDVGWIIAIVPRFVTCQCNSGNKRRLLLATIMLLHYCNSLQLVAFAVLLPEQCHKLPTRRIILTRLLSNGKRVCKCKKCQSWRFSGSQLSVSINQVSLHAISGGIITILLNFSRERFLERLVCTAA